MHTTITMMKKTIQNPHDSKNLTAYQSLNVSLCLP
jgi:hypothetical protein